MIVKLFKSTKYKKKILSPGTHDVTQKSAKEWIKIGIAREVTEDKKNLTAKKEKTAVEIMDDGQLAELQVAAKELKIDIDGKSYDDLLEEVELARELDLEE